MGNDGNMWTAVMNVKNICQWKPDKTGKNENPKPVKECPKGKVRSPSGRCVKDRKPSAAKPKPVKDCPKGKVRSPSGRCVKECPKGKVRSPSGRCVKEKKPMPSKPGTSNTNVNSNNTGNKKTSGKREAMVVAQLKDHLIASRRYEWASANIKNISSFKKNASDFDILIPIKDWKDGDIIQYNYFTPGVIGALVSKTKLIPTYGEDYLQIPEEMTKYSDDVLTKYKTLLNNYTVGDTIYLSNKDKVLKQFLKPTLLKKVNKLSLKRPIFSLSIDKLGYPNIIYLQISFPPESPKDWSKNYRVTRAVGEVNIDRDGKLTKGKIDDEKELIKLIERTIGKKL